MRLRAPDMRSRFPAQVVSLADPLLNNLDASAEAPNAAPAEPVQRCDMRTVQTFNTLAR